MAKTESDTAEWSGVGAVPSRPLTRKRSITAVVSGVVGASAAAVAAAAVVSGWPVAETMSSNLDKVLLGFLVVPSVFAVTAAVITVTVNGRREKAVVFRRVFGAILAPAVFVIMCLFVSAGTLTPQAPFAPLAVVAAVALAMLWFGPAVSVRLVRGRAVLLALVIAAVLGVVANTVGTVIGDAQAADAAHPEWSQYRGPSYAPSTAPRSPLAGYELTRIELPTSNYPGVVLAYERLDDGRKDAPPYYTLFFTDASTPFPCADVADGCDVVGQVRGAELYRLGGDYYLPDDDGTIELQSLLNTSADRPLSPADAITVLGDLRPASLEDLSRLAVRGIPASNAG